MALRNMQHSSGRPQKRVKSIFDFNEDFFRKNDSKISILDEPKALLTIFTTLYNAVKGYSNDGKPYPIFRIDVDTVIYDLYGAKSVASRIVWAKCMLDIRAATRSVGDYVAFFAMLNDPKKYNIFVALVKCHAYSTSKCVPKGIREKYQKEYSNGIKNFRKVCGIKTKYTDDEAISALKALNDECKKRKRDHYFSGGFNVNIFNELDALSDITENNNPYEESFMSRIGKLFGETDEAEEEDNDFMESTDDYITKSDLVDFAKILANSIVDSIKTNESSTPPSQIKYEPSAETLIDNYDSRISSTNSRVDEISDKMDTIMDLLHNQKSVQATTAGRVKSENVEWNNDGILLGRNEYSDDDGKVGDVINPDDIIANHQEPSDENEAQ